MLRGHRLYLSCPPRTYSFYLHVEALAEGLEQLPRQPVREPGEQRGALSQGLDLCPAVSLQVQLDNLPGMSLMAGKALSSARMSDAVLSQSSLMASQQLRDRESEGKDLAELQRRGPEGMECCSRSGSGAEKTTPQPALQSHLCCQRAVPAGSGGVRGLWGERVLMRRSSLGAAVSRAWAGGGSDTGFLAKHGAALPLQ